MLHLHLHLRAQLTHDTADIETPKSAMFSLREVFFLAFIRLQPAAAADWKQLFLHILSESRGLKCTFAPTAFECRTMEQTNKLRFAGAILLSGH